MKSIFTIVCFFCFTHLYAQTDSRFDELLLKGKAEFRKEYDQQDYNKAVTYLEQAVYVNPENAEAHYFLGYAYSRLNSKDAVSLVESSLSLTMKASEQFEEVIKINPKYNGEKVLLDPYSKLTAEWGTMAIGYFYNDQKDSAIWAFQEGKRRGGFSDFILAYNKRILDACDENGILLSCGDNFTLPLWYLQIVEGYRKDIVVVDVNLLNTTWYPDYLITHQVVPFDINREELEALDYCEWKEKEVVIDDFSWTLHPSYYNQYLLRGDRVLLSMIKALHFQKNIYFTTYFDEEFSLSLKKHVLPLLFVDKINVKNEEPLIWNQYEKEQKKLLDLVKMVNQNSQDEAMLIEGFRFNILARINEYLSVGNKKYAKKLHKLMEKYINEDIYPYTDEVVAKYVMFLESHL